MYKKYYAYSIGYDYVNMGLSTEQSFMNKSKWIVDICRIYWTRNNTLLHLNIIVLLCKIKIKEEFLLIDPQSKIL